MKEALGVVVGEEELVGQGLWTLFRRGFRFYQSMVTLWSAKHVTIRCFKKFTWARESVDLLRCLACKHRTLSLIPRTHVKTKQG